MTSKQLYDLYRQVRSMQDALEEANNGSGTLDNAIKIADTLSEEIFKCVGKLAAYEIDNEYWEKKNNNTD